MARLTRLSWPKGAEIRQWPCTVHARDRYEVKYYKEEVLITLVSILNITLLAIIYAVTYIYSK
jgi:hypothetical protein